MKDGEDAGEKKVTFNDTTEEKNYTKDREVDEEGIVVRNSCPERNN